MKLLCALLVLIALAALYLILAPSPVDPVAYQPPPKPAMTGVLAPNTLLREAELIAAGKIDGPEDTAIGPDGLIYAGTQDGKVMRVHTDGTMETFAVTGGRPLGLHFDAAGNIITCDADRGLLSIDKKGAITTLASGAEGVPFRFTDDLDIARDGTVYFTDASDKFKQADYLFDLLEGRPHGRLLSYNPRNRETRVLIRNMYFANGVALSTNEDFLLVNETYRYRIRRYWLKGPKAGNDEIFIDNLPGFPDNISSNRRGTFWLALFTVRNDLMDRLHPFPSLKRIMSMLPHFTWPKPEPYGLVLALDEQGRIVRSLHDPSGEKLCIITSAVEHGGHLYFGSLHEKKIGKLSLGK
jgi:sugar lactone lactonase YvrE